MSPSEAQSILDNVCPCTDPMCPDSVHLSLIAEAREVVATWTDSLFDRLLATCQEYGFVTERTRELLFGVVDSIYLEES